MRKLRTTAIVATIAVAALLTMGSSCEDNSGQAKDGKARQVGFDALQAKQPATYMEYSPTRNGIKFFADKWGKDPNKLSYAYLLNMNGDVIGYYVLKGLPISYCAQMLPPQVRDNGGASTIVVPAPGVDGAYYSGNSGCTQYYGIDATTNSYIEFSVGGGISFLVHEQPIGRPETDRRALGPTAIGQER